VPPGQPGTGRVRRSSLFGRVLASLATLAVVTVAVMFSVALMALAVIMGAAVFGWLWWQMRRALRKARQDQGSSRSGTSTQAGPEHHAGNVIEGEVIKSEWQDGPEHRD